MATTQPALAAGRGLVAARITLLGDDGSRDYCGQADTSAYSLCPQSIAVSVDTEAGETQTIRCGNGEVFASVVTADTTTGLELTLTLVPIDLEFIILATGATPLVVGGDYVGLSGGEVAGPVVELHAWAEAFAGSAQAASPHQYWHHAWPFVQFRRVPTNIEEGFGVVTLVGQVQGNLNLGNGSFLDIPVEAFEASSHFSAFWRDNDAPDDTVSPYNNGLGGGFIATPACAS